MFLTTIGIGQQVRDGEHPETHEWSGCPFYLPSLDDEFFGDRTFHLNRFTLKEHEHAEHGSGCANDQTSPHGPVFACGTICLRTAGCKAFNVVISGKSMGRCCLKSNLDKDGKWRKSHGSQFYEMKPRL